MAAEEWAVKLVREELERASDTDDSRDREALQALGIGAGDLEAVVDVLLEEGSVSEEAPGVYRWLSEEMRPAAAAPEPDSEPGAEPEPPARAVEALAAAVLDDLGVGEATRERTLILSRPMVQAMDPVQLGAVVMAAVNGEEHRVIVLRIEP